MNSNLLWQGLELMAVGMGTVFVFLTLLVLATSTMSRLVLHWYGEPAAETARGDSGPGENAEEIAAITAAIALHRQRQRGAGE